MWWKSKKRARLRGGFPSSTPRRFLFAIFLGLFAGSVSPAEQARTGWERHLDRLSPTSPTTVTLPESVLFRDSIQVEIAGATLVAGVDFRVGYEERQIILLRAYPEGSEVVIRYRKLPVYWETRQRWAQPAKPDSFRSDSTSIPAIRTGPIRRQPTPETNLRIGGNKTFAVQVGSGRDLTLEQSLRVSISGTIAENVSVTAELSDQNLPIQPEGTTEELQEIDKVLIEVKSPHYGALLGSFDATHSVGEFGGFSRRLDGVMGSVGYDGWGASAALASSRGEFRSCRIPVIDGNQGPYRLPDRDGNTGVIVLAGTERVWIDGHLLIRGEPNDYVMDYSAGEITFTAKRFLRDDMEVLIDYEYTTESYSRTTSLLAGHKSSRGGAFRTRVVFVQEGDNTGESFGIELDDAARAILAVAGDDRTKASRPGWSLRQGGRYRLVDATTEHFAVAEADSGDYDVTFTRVGPGNGSYVRRGGYFDQDMVFVGQGNGDWLPRVSFPLPVRNRLGAFWAEFQPTRLLSMEAEAAVSDIDRNVLSSIGDQDNTHFAGSFLLEGNALPLGERFGSLGLRAKARSVDEGFGSLYRTIAPYDNRRWGLSVSEPRDQETTGELSARLSMPRDQAVDWDAGWFRRDSVAGRDGHRAWRTGVSWRAASEGSPTGTVHAERISMAIESANTPPVSGEILRGGAEVRVPIDRLVTSARWEGERDERFRRSLLWNGTRYGDFSGEIATASWESFAASAGFQSRTNSSFDTLLAGWQRNQRSLTQTWRAAVRSWKGFSTTAEYSWRKRDGTAVGGSNTADNARVDLRHEAFRGALRNDFRYQIASSRTARRERLFLFVGNGRGEYASVLPDDRRAILSENEVLMVPVGDPSAAYVLRFRDTDDFSPTVTLDAAWLLNTDLGRLWRGAADPRSNRERPLWQRALRAVSTETSLIVNETDSSRTRDLYLVKFWRFRRAGESPTVRGSLRITQDATLRSPSGLGDIRFRIAANEDYDASLFAGTGIPATTRQREHSVRSRIRVNARTDWTIEMKRQRDFRVGSSLDYSVLRHWLDQSFAFRTASFEEFSLRNEIGRGEDPHPAAAFSSSSTKPLVSHLFSLEPAWRESWGNRGVLRASAQWSGVFTKNANARGTLPVHLLNGRNAGNNFRATVLASFRLSALATASLSYSARRNAGTPLVHTTRAEVNAVF